MKNFSLATMLCATAFSLNVPAVLGATYYLSTTGNDSNSCTAAQSSSTAKKTFSSAWGCLSAGSTLIVGDGTYTNVSPPAGKAGSSGSPIVVQAQNDGGAVMSGGLNLVGSSYIDFAGFKVVNADDRSLSVYSNGAGNVSHHLSFRRMGFYSSGSSNIWAGAGLWDGTHHVLMEDSWFWGTGRYTLSCYGGDPNPNHGCDYNTFRRLVIRMGPSPRVDGTPDASFALYYSSNNIVENVIAIDGQQDGPSSNAAFYFAAHEPLSGTTGSHDNKFYGVIALNNMGVGWYVDTDTGDGSNNELRNSVLWGQQSSGMAMMSRTCSGIVVDHVTLQKWGGTEGVWNGCGLTLTNTIFANGGSKAVSNGGSLSQSYNNMYNNSGGNGVTPASTVNPSLKYIARVESNGPTHGIGSGGSDIGANVINRYQDGVQTSTPLWPWPNEARIRKEMCTDSGVTKGFCAKGSLTEYVWTYLGNAVPSDFGGSTVPKSACDLNSDGAVNSTDVDLARQQAVGVTACTNADLQGTGTCDVIDVQRVINAALGGACKTGQ